MWLAIILGTVVEEKQTSTKDRLQRKKDMGMCRWESGLMARRMSRFPRTVARYLLRKSTKRSFCRWGCLESPRRRNSELLDWFVSPMGLGTWVQRQTKQEKFKSLENDGQDGAVKKMARRKAM